MVTLLCAFLIGCVCGLRSMTAPAVVAWGAHLGWLHLQGFTARILHQQNLPGDFLRICHRRADRRQAALHPCPHASRAACCPGHLWRDVRCSLVYFRCRIAAVWRAAGSSGRGSRCLRRLQLPPHGWRRWPPIWCWPCLKIWLPSAAVSFSSLADRKLTANSDLPASKSLLCIPFRGNWT